LLLFTFYKGEPIAFFLMIPDLNQALKHVNGKLNFWAKMVLLYHLKVKKSITNIIGVIFGVTPEFQGKGVDSAMAASRERAIREMVRGLTRINADL
jgi:GNAT superfamily N-acetyltransferase